MFLIYIQNIKKWKNKYPKIDTSTLENEYNAGNEVAGIALLGDIGNPKKVNYYEFLAECSRLFKNVYLLSGNHEYYTKYMSTGKFKSSVTENIQMAITNAHNKSKINNIFYLNNNSKEVLPKKFIIGSTLWSDHSKSITSNKRELNDFYNLINKEHSKSVDFIRCEINKIIWHTKLPNITVLTHYLPTYKLVSDNYKDLNDFNPAQNERYYSNQEHLIKYPVKNWLCGHSHTNMDIVINSVNLGINCFHNNTNNSLVKLKYVEL